jgi:hypothetical protein
VWDVPTKLPNFLEKRGSKGRQPLCGVWGVSTKLPISLGEERRRGQEQQRSFATAKKVDFLAQYDYNTNKYELLQG